MSSAPYFRRQSELCARLALATTDEEWTKKFALLSLQYLAKAVELEEASPLACDALVDERDGETEAAEAERPRG